MSRYVSEIWQTVKEKKKSPSMNGLVNIDLSRYSMKRMYLPVISVTLMAMLVLTACSPGVGQPQQGSIMRPGMMSDMPMMQGMMGNPQTAEMVGTS